MKNKYFYISTPVFYPSAKLHIGHTYTTVLADTINRYKKTQGYETFFVTGSDEHGQKILDYSKKNNSSPKEFVDKITNTFKELWKNIDIKYDVFVRTTAKQHCKVVKNVFQQLKANEDIYFGDYKDRYCTSCEEFLTYNQINIKNNTCLVCLNQIKIISEGTYFFKANKYSSFLKNYYKDHPNFIEPIKIKNEMLNTFFKEKLNDLSVSRKSMNWGITIPFDNKYTVYVWIDALVNYISVLNYSLEDDRLFSKFWSDDCEIIHIIGIEISRFHTIYWPAILKSLNLRLPSRIIAHGWIMFKNHKMSKSLNNIVDPNLLINRYGADVLRFFLMNDINMNNGGVYNHQLFLQSLNTNLVNNLGNLVNRCFSMINKYFDCGLNSQLTLSDPLISELHNNIELFKNYMNDFRINDATQLILNIANKTNKLIEDSKPWELFKDNDFEQLDKILKTVAYTIYIIFYCLAPFIPVSSKKVLKAFANINNINWNNIKNLVIWNQKIIINKIKILFLRVDIEAETEWLNKAQ